MESKRFVTELRENENVATTFLVTSKNLGTTRSGRPFVRVVLADRTGRIEGRIWEKALELDDHFSVNDVVRLDGRAERYREKLQINISTIERCDVKQVDPSLFLPKSPQDPDQQWQKLKDLAAQVENLHLKRLLQSFLSDRDFCRQLKQAPAAKSMHHAYLGGLLEHTVSVVRLLNRICDHYPFLDRDLLVSAGILHDIGKLKEFSYQRSLDYTDAGRLLGHVVLGVQRVQEKIDKLKDFPPSLALTLQHLIVSHHGEYEFGAPKRPKSIEAFALHYADDLDAKMNHLFSLLEAEKEDPSAWTTFQSVYDRYVFKGVREELPLDSRAVHHEESEEQVNYSFLDKLAAGSKGEDR